ncbi:hypothetical protein ACFE04_030059 [Oxalis oulophora]
MDDYNSLEKAFGLYNSDQFSSSNVVDQMMMVDALNSSQVQVTQNSSISSSSTEAGGGGGADEEDSSTKKSESKGSDDHDPDGEESSNKKLGNAGAGIFSSSLLSPSPLMAGVSNFNPHYDFLMQMAPHINSANHNSQGVAVSTYATHNLNNPSSTNHHHQISAADYGLLQDMVPPMFLKQEP